jgi:hypothetical protein
MSRTETDPVTSGNDTDSDDGYAHYADKAEITRAAIMGGLVTALCGHKFPPIRDPQRFPCARAARSWRGCWGSADERCWSVRTRSPSLSS